MKRLVLILGALALGASALAAPALASGVDSHAYSCAGLQSLIAQYRFVFIGNPDFEDFVVADGSLCSGDQVAEWRSVPTSDQPECVVKQCWKVSGGAGD